MKYLLLLFLIQLISINVFADVQTSYMKARKQYMLEYTVFGVDECLSQNQEKLVVEKSEKELDKIVVGSKEYFNLLAQCFQKFHSQCVGESCIVSQSMKKRIEGIRHVEKYLSKL
ncbi:hypothetical protein [Bacteriovorax sp. DB6_IX]|uniref:hypothetical protein n=3 Tax=Bacteriovorax sp. DB6_IX TaxID=1353530 RepID=UPI000389EB52|nr:hypothetical protein [Bacteriovorax sp. DB6_IX]EQC51648.1 hypothetical protein M901_0234 [Bacteriovorax sp. DB6_IX]